MKRHLPYLSLISLLACGEQSTTASGCTSNDECKNDRVCVEGICTTSADSLDMMVDATSDNDASFETPFPGTIYFSTNFEGELSNSMFQFDTETRKASKMVDSQGNIVDISNFEGERFSPKFTKLAYVLNDNDSNPEKSKINIYNLSNGQTTFVTPTHYGTQLAWEDENTLLFSSSSITEGHLTTTIYKWVGDSPFPVQTFPLQGFIMYLDMVDMISKKSIVYNCVSDEKMRMAEEHKDDYNQAEINFPQELCTADVRGDEFFPMMITDINRLGYVLIGNKLQWDNGNVSTLDVENPNGGPSVYTVCKKNGENTPIAMCVWGLANNRPFLEVPFPQSGYEMRSFIVSPDHKSFLLDMENFWDRRDNTLVPVGFDHFVVDGKNLGGELFRVVAFKPR